MCWSGEASAVVAAVGFTSTGYAAWRREPAPLWAALGYFSLMEVLRGCESRMAVMSAAWFVEFRQRLPWLLQVD